MAGQPGRGLDVSQYAEWRPVVTACVLDTGSTDV
jgi:hypothetical protein